MELEVKRLQLYFFLEVLYYLEHLYIKYTDIIDMIITPIFAATSALQTTTAMNIIRKPTVQGGTYVEMEIPKDVPKIQSYTSKFVEYSFYTIVSIFILLLLTSMFYVATHGILWLLK